MSGMQWYRISHGKAACAAQPQDLSPTLQKVRWQGTDIGGRQLKGKKPPAGLRNQRRLLHVGIVRSPPLT
jgi:hypothetical protein